MAELPQPVPPRDVQVRAVLPPEPFAQLMPGTVIEVGDLKHVGNNAWDVVTLGEIGQKVPMCHGAAVARLMMPEGCVAVLDSDVLGAQDQLWTTVEPNWACLPTGWAGKRVSEAVDALRHANQQSDFRVYVCRPSEPVDDSGCENLPAHFRRLGVGEVVRRGDRWWFAGRWEKCPSAIGDVVRDTQAKHFIRPVAMDARTWYVDLRADGLGDDVTGLGSHERPFASVEGACKRIEATFKNPCGVLWDVRGVPITAWDLPEPPADPPAMVPEQEFESDAVLVQHRAAPDRTYPFDAESSPPGAERLKPEDRVQAGDYVHYCDTDHWVVAQEGGPGREYIGELVHESARFPNKRALFARPIGAVIKNRLEVEPKAFQGLCAAPSGHRLLVRGEVVGAGDLYRRPNMTHWAPVTSQPGLSIQVGLAVDAIGDWLEGWVIYARPTDEHHLQQLAGPQCSAGPQGCTGEKPAPVPDAWRELQIGEELRAGDLVWDKRWKSWYPVSNRDLRLELQAGDRACRVSVA